MAPLKISESVTGEPKAEMAPKKERMWRAAHSTDVPKMLEPKSSSSIGGPSRRDLKESDAVKADVSPSDSNLSNIKLKRTKSKKRGTIDMKSKAKREEPFLLPLQSSINVPPSLGYLHSSHQQSSRVNTFSAPLGQSTVTTFGYSESTDATNSVNVGLAGVILAMVSVLFIIFGIAFVYRLRDKFHEEDSEEEQRKKDPIEVWLTTEEPPFLPAPPLKKKVKNVVCSVHRKISGKPDPNKFIPGCPPHLRYQLKNLIVY